MPTVLPTPDARLEWVPRHPTSVRLTLGRAQQGGADPTQQRASDGAIWRTIRTPVGDAVARFDHVADAVRCLAWGDGAAHAVAQAPALLGDHDDPSGFVPAHPYLAVAHRMHPGLRIAGSGDMLHGMVGAILEQRVEALVAFTSWTRLVRRLGEPAPEPAPAGMRMFPSGAAWLGVEQGEWRAFDVDLGRAAAIRWAAARERSLQRLVEEGRALADVDRALRSLPGIGPWTSAEVRQRVLGDADAVSIGDFHLATVVGRTLAGRAFDDAELVAFLEPWRGHRYRVARLVYAGGFERAPRRAPRRSPGPQPRAARPGAGG
ncbi:3-methyladenine DNA glycosylase [Agrococcus sp. SGAir0287]|nr:3-methyladenine DNA glycosylase [Agrococcus sp. SGAir0287]